MQDWPTAGRDFHAAASLLAGYPEPFFSRLAPLAIETALNGGDLTEAKRLVGVLAAHSPSRGQPSAQILFLRGEIARLSGAPQQAAVAYQEVAGSSDRLYSTRGELALVDLGLKQGTMTPDQAVDRLERLRYAWRGDDLEFDIVHRLGQVYVLAGRYDEGLATMRDVATAFADSPHAKDLAGEMAKTFADLFLRGGADKLPALKALALYENFRELTPAGADGDEVVQRLAERLVEIDLLDRAADLLKHQVDFRLAGADKARVAARLAAIDLLDSRPNDALAALDSSAATDLPNDLSKQRELLRARALSRLDRPGEALAVLGDDVSKPALLLRVDVAWHTQQWPQAAAALGQAIGAPPAAGTMLDPGTAKLVLNRAIALSLAGDAASLEALRRDFGAALPAGQDADMFRLLTQPEEAVGLLDRATIEKRIADVDAFQSLLTGYLGKHDAGADAAPAKPDAGKPDAGKAAAAKPDAGKPDQAKPSMAKAPAN